MSFDEQPDKDYKWDIHYHDYSTEHKVRVIAHCKHCARCRFERKNADCVVLAVAPVADDQPDGDIHGERAAESEPSELSAFEKWWAMLSKVPYMSKKEIAERAFYAGETASHELRFDACRPYLKEGETVADALIRMQKEITTLRNAAMQLWAGRSTFDKGNDMSKAESTTTVQWFKNGDHPLDYAEDREGLENGELVTFSAALCKSKEWEGAIVRYFRHPNIDGLVDCHLCGATMHEHGRLDDGETGPLVCPGDLIVTTDGRHAVVQQPDRAEAADRAQQAQDMKDAARYRLLRRGQHWSVIDGIGDTLRAEALDASIDKARAAQEAAG